MAITLDGTNGITTPDVTSSGSLNIDASAPDDSLVVDASGNLGLGVTPSGWASDRKAMQVNLASLSGGNGNNFAVLGNNIYNDGAGAGNKYISTAAASSYVQNTAGEHIWYTAPSGTAGTDISLSERARITSQGYFMIGGTTPLGGNGSENISEFFYSGGGSGGYCAINSDSANAPLYLSRTAAQTTGIVIYFGSNGSNVGTITTNGSSTSYNTTSDYRLKENVVGVTGAAARVQQLNPVRFNFIADPDTTVDGFLAHEVQDVVPEAITGTKDAVDAEGNPEYQGIDQSKLVPLLTAALQEALTKIDSLETRIAALEAA